MSRRSLDLIKVAKYSRDLSKDYTTFEAAQIQIATAVSLYLPLSFAYFPISSFKALRHSTLPGGLFFKYS